VVSQIYEKLVAGDFIPREFFCPRNGGGVVELPRSLRESLYARLHHFQNSEIVFERNRTLRSSLKGRLEGPSAIAVPSKQQRRKVETTLVRLMDLLAQVRYKPVKIVPALGLDVLHAKPPLFVYEPQFTPAGAGWRKLAPADA
jgi:hypothetical protein